MSLGLALISLSPILLMVRWIVCYRDARHIYLIIVKPAYAALVVQTREVLLIHMWGGQLVCEGVSWLLKRAVKQDRPEGMCVITLRKTVQVDRLSALYRKCGERVWIPVITQSMDGVFRVVLDDALIFSASVYQHGILGRGSSV